jgi:hypothetical protein
MLICHCTFVDGRVYPDPRQHCPNGHTRGQTIRDFYEPPSEELVEELDADKAELQRRITAIITAWEDAGPVPAHHERIKTYVRGVWPTLADAIDMLCVLDSLDQANNTITDGSHL